MAISQILHVGSIFTAKGTDGIIVGAQWAVYWAVYWATEWPKSGPFLIFTQRNQISFLIFVYVPKSDSKLK